MKITQEVRDLQQLIRDNYPDTSIEDIGSDIMSGLDWVEFTTIYDDETRSSSPVEGIEEDDTGKKTVIKFTKIGVALESVEQYGGEGMGDQYWGVAKFTTKDKEILVRVNGYWVSHDGAHCYDYNEWEQVKPVEVMKIEYRSVK